MISSVVDMTIIVDMVVVWHGCSLSVVSLSLSVSDTYETWTMSPAAA
jgi:hypothetical protein